ncbi:hypothetical protein ABVT39_010656 [Epinephelus coioides]
MRTLLWGPGTPTGCDYYDMGMKLADITGVPATTRTKHWTEMKCELMAKTMKYVCELWTLKRPTPGPENVSQEEPSGQCADCEHSNVIVHLKREILELRRSLEADREQRANTLPERPCPTCLGNAEHTDGGSSATTGNRMSDAHRYTLHELELCKRDLDNARATLADAYEEREALRVKLAETQTVTVAESTESCVTKETGDAHPHLDWVGRHYLAVMLPEDRMFKPGQAVTPVGVLQKLFEMRVGDKPATGFSLLLENIHIMFSHMEPDWYAKHFGFCRAHVCGNYKSAYRIDTEDFAWLLFEYGAHAPLVEVLARLMNVLTSTGKGGVTAAALCTSKNMYSSYVTLFKETVSKAYDGFLRVRNRARMARKAQGVVYMPLTVGLGATQPESQDDPQPNIRNRVLRSVLEGCEPPAPICNTSASVTTDSISHNDPLDLDRSLSTFMKRRGLAGGGVESRASADRSNQEYFPRTNAMSHVPSLPLEKRVLFHSPWSNDM